MTRTGVRRWLACCLDQEVAGPGKAVGDQRPEQCVPRMSEYKGRNHHGRGQSRTPGVHHAVAPIAVFVQVKGEEFFVSCEFLLVQAISPRDEAGWDAEDQYVAGFLLFRPPGAGNWEQTISSSVKTILWPAPADCGKSERSSCGGILHPA